MSLEPGEGPKVIPLTGDGQTRVEAAMGGGTSSTRIGVRSTFAADVKKKRAPVYTYGNDRNYAK